MEGRRRAGSAGCCSLLVSVDAAAERAMAMKVEEACPRSMYIYVYRSLGVEGRQRAGTAGCCGSLLSVDGGNRRSLLCWKGGRDDDGSEGGGGLPSEYMDIYRDETKHRRNESKKMNRYLLLHSAETIKRAKGKGCVG